MKSHSLPKLIKPKPYKKIFKEKVNQFGKELLLQNLDSVQKLDDSSHEIDGSFL